jgi:hypothetical protein
MRSPAAHDLAGYAANSIEKTGEGYSSTLRAILYRCIQMLYAFVLQVSAISATIDQGRLGMEM